MQWLASLKPSTTNIPEYIMKEYSFEEIQVFTVQLLETDFDKYKQVLEFIHKYIPFQILLILSSDESLIYSTCDKRINLADTSKRTIESYTQTEVINKLYQRQIEKKFLKSLHFRELNKTSLETTYQSYVKAIVQYNTAIITGKYQSRNRVRSKQDAETLKQIENLNTEIVSIKSQIKKASSFSVKTKLNIDLQKKRNSIQELKDNLSNGE